MTCGVAPDEVTACEAIFPAQCRKLFDAWNRWRMPCMANRRCWGFLRWSVPPDSIDSNAYLHILRWFMRDGEELTGTAFIYQLGTHDLVGMIPQVLGKRVDAVWDSFGSGVLTSVIVKTTATVPIVNQHASHHCIAAHILHSGRDQAVHPTGRNRVRQIAEGCRQGDPPTIEIIAEHEDLLLMFSKQVVDEVVEFIASGLDGGAVTVTEREVASMDSVGAEFPTHCRLTPASLTNMLSNNIG